MNRKIILTHEEVLKMAFEFGQRLFISQPPNSKIKIWGIPRGGIPVCYLLIATHPKRFQIIEDAKDCDVIIDDLTDSGATMKSFCHEYKKIGYPLIEKHKTSPWYVFPWENSIEGSAEDIPIRLLQFIGEDVTRGGLKETPKRFLKAWQEWTIGYKQTAKEVLKTFEDGGENYDEMVLVKDIPIYSHCEHHLAPFFGVAHVAYIPDGKIVGLSKLSRLVDVFARRLQVQERLTNQIAEALDQHLEPKGIGVVLECRHLCMESRGIQKIGSKTLTSSLKGVMMENDSTRAEFFQLLK